MKKKMKTIISASTASVLAFATLAQASPESNPDYTRDRAPAARHSDRLNGAAKASDVIGMTVKNYQDEKLGKVEDLGVDVESGRIVQVILSIGGFLGIGDTLTAVPPGALHYDIPQKVLHLDANKEKLTGAPKFDSARWDEGTQSNRVTEVYSYYGEEPYFFADRDRSAQTREDVKIVSTLPRHLDGTLNTDAPRSVETVRNTEAVENVARTQNTRSTRNADGTWSREYYPSENGTNRDVALNQNRGSNPTAKAIGNEEDGPNMDAPNNSGSRLGQVQKASKLIGTSVKNLQDEKLGKVENILLDLPSGRIVAVIVSAGGFLGMGDELSAVPPTALRFTTDPDTLQLDTTKEMLSSAPHFKANQWPDFAEPGYAGGVYRAYQVEPYFSSEATTDADNTRQNIRARDERTSGTTEPDNTARNIRDRKDQTLTPLNQGTSKADVATTAQIRKEIIAGKNMSVNARNVKIITIDGRVTLRGPVNTAEEKRLIGEIANRSVHSDQVDNQLEVKATRSGNY
jgi:hyperosmotically inducible periplasmic protein